MIRGRIFARKQEIGEVAEWLTKSLGAILDAEATRRRPKGEGQDAPSQRARLESECTFIAYRGFESIPYR